MIVISILVRISPSQYYYEHDNRYDMTNVCSSILAEQRTKLVDNRLSARHTTIDERNTFENVSSEKKWLTMNSPESYEYFLRRKFSVEWVNCEWPGICSTERPFGWRFVRCRSGIWTRRLMSGADNRRRSKLLKCSSRWRWSIVDGCSLDRLSCRMTIDDRRRTNDSIDRWI
jgi:hypothetical protein